MDSDENKNMTTFWVLSTLSPCCQPQTRGLVLNQVFATTPIKKTEGHYEENACMYKRCNEFGFQQSIS